MLPRMLTGARIAAIVPVSDVEAAVHFYGDTLGLKLKERRSDLPENREAEFEAGDGMLLVYESVGAGQSRHTVAGFRVDDIDAAVSTLRERGVAFEEYDLPGPQDRERDRVSRRRARRVVQGSGRQHPRRRVRRRLERPLGQ